jgi:hypothetical protein
VEIKGDINMTRESLQAKCNENNLKIKILSVEKTEYEDYEVVYTFDLDYQGRDSYEDYIIEPELDELVKDEEEFIFMISFRSVT